MRLPAEWEPQQKVLLTLPTPAAGWGPLLPAATSALIKAANKIHQVTPVLLLVGDQEHFQRYAATFEGQVVCLPTNDCWVRDYGPLTIFHHNELQFQDFRFNGWGGKFPAKEDNQVTATLHHRLFPKLNYQRIPFELEGGSIETDGQGTFLTTTRCLLHPNRRGNEASKAAVESQLSQHLGASHFHWLHHGHLAGDDTDAHIDTLARFLDPRTIAYVHCDDHLDEHFHQLKRMETELKTFRDSQGNPYHLIPLPWCPPVYSPHSSQRLPASYANFVLSNGQLFLPSYYDNEPNQHPGRLADRQAQSILQTQSSYQVHPIPSRTFLEQGGSLHCLTMQIPRPKSSE